MCSELTRNSLEDGRHVVFPSELDDMVVEFIIFERGDFRVVEDIEGCFDHLTVFNEFIRQFEWTTL